MIEKINAVQQGNYLLPRDHFKRAMCHRAEPPQRFRRYTDMMRDKDPLPSYHTNIVPYPLSSFQIQCVTYHTGTGSSSYRTVPHHGRRKKKHSRKENTNHPHMYQFTPGKEEKGGLYKYKISISVSPTILLLLIVSRSLTATTGTPTAQPAPGNKALVRAQLPRHHRAPPNQRKTDNLQPCTRTVLYSTLPYNMTRYQLPYSIHPKSLVCSIPA